MEDDDLWRLRVRYTLVGLGKLTVGGSIMAHGIRNANISPWAFPQFAFGGAMLTSGLIHLSLAWDMDPPPNDLAPNGRAPRVGIPLANNERRYPDLAGEGLIIHQNLPPIADGIRDVGKANLHDVEETRPANVVAGERRAGSGGMLRRRPVQRVLEDQGIGDSNESGPGNAVAEVGQAKASEEVGQAKASEEVGQAKASEEVGQAKASEEVDQADDVEESNQADNECELEQGTEESESKKKEVHEINEPGQASNIGEVMADSLENIAECADKDDVTDEGESDIELPRSSEALSLDITSIKFIDSCDSDCESSY